MLFEVVRRARTQSGMIPGSAVDEGQVSLFKNAMSFGGACL